MELLFVFLSQFDHVKRKVSWLLTGRKIKHKDFHGIYQLQQIQIVRIYILLCISCFIFKSVLCGVGFASCFSYHCVTALV